MDAIISMPRAAGVHLLSLGDLDPASIAGVLSRAAELKVNRGSVAFGPPPLAGKSVALIFEKPSLRTRVSFEIGVAKLGGVTTTLTGGDVGLGTREPVEDVARTLGRYVDVIVVRTLSHDTLAALAAASDVPVINALTAHEHPCQALADLLTLQERFGDVSGRLLAFVGDGNNVCHSLLLGGAALGLHVRVATPPGHGPDASVIDEAFALSRASGSRIEIGHEPAAAVRGADAVYTDVWASMGSEHEADVRRRAFTGFRVTNDLLAHAPHAVVMHCLPAHRGDEIDAAVLDGPRSVCFDQAENRLYVQQAVLLGLLEASHDRPGSARYSRQLDLALLRPAAALG